MSGAWDWVQAVAEADQRLRIVDDDAAQDLVARVKRKFVEDPRRLWWWESLRGPTESVQYDEVALGLELLRSRIESQPMINLIVTDNRREPSGVVAGTPEAILNLLAETPLFEFAVTDPEVRWLMLDNHHNVLIMAGDIPQAAA